MTGANGVSDAAAGWQVRVESDASPARIEPLWRDLQARSEHSFFQSWAWIGAWLKTITEKADLIALEVWRGDRLVGLSVLGRNTVTHSRVFASRALLVSEAGDPGHDALTVEHSGLLMERGMERDIVRRALVHLRDLDWQWDELHVSGVEMSQAAMYIDAAERAGLTPIVRTEHPYFFVDLQALRDAARGTGHTDAYLATLSANTRYQIRRSMRLYAARDGALTLQVAATEAQALEFFDQLREVHQRCWRARGKPGAFASDRLTGFHRTLISESFDAGEVQLVRVAAGALDFGYLYNFVMGGVVSNYQTGFRYEDDSRLKPGLVSHALAIAHNARSGNRVFDFLMGEQRYKRSLAHDEALMQWLVLRRGGLPRSIGSGLRGLGRLFGGR